MRTIRPPLVHPLLLTWTKRVWLALFPEGRPPQDDPWSGLLGLRARVPRLDGMPASSQSLLLSWPPASCDSLDHACGKTKSASCMHDDAPSAWAKLPSRPARIVFCRLDGASPSSSWDKAISLRASGKSVWWEVLPTQTSWSAWTDETVRESLRAGISWWWAHPCASAPPSDWDAYAEHLSQQGQRMLQTSSWDQWAWPWVELMQENLVDVITHGDIRRRQVLPAGADPATASEWLRVRRHLWKKMQECSGGDGVWEEVLLAVLLRHREQATG